MPPEMAARIPWLLALLLAACGPGPAKEPEPAAKPPTRDEWWTRATTRSAGLERILAPRELRALLQEGERLGFHSDEGWWRERKAWVYERILDLDPADVEANRGLGRNTLQGYPGFAALWERVVACPAPDDNLRALLEEYDPLVQEDHPIFLNDGQWEVARAKLKDAEAYLAKLEKDEGFAALQQVLARVQATMPAEFPAIHVAAGPFLVFFCARDLARIPSEKPEEEAARVAGRAEAYRKILEEKRSIYEALLADFAATFPAAWALRPIGPRDGLVQWIFADEATYNAYFERIGKEGEPAPGRCGRLESWGWAFLFVPPPPQPQQGGESAPPVSSDPLGESAAYLAALQVLRRLGEEPDTGKNAWATAKSLWVEEGVASWLAGRRVKTAAIGQSLARARKFKYVFPPIRRVVERESWLELRNYREPIEEDPDERPPLHVARGFSDLSWLLVDELAASRKAAFEAYLTALLQGKAPGAKAFADSLALKDEAAWAALDRALSQRVDTLPAPP